MNIDMKECGILQIGTNSIKQFLEDTFEKEVNNLLISDLLLVESLTIEGRNCEGLKEVTSFKDLKHFKNLMYLEISHVLITNTIINILSNLNYLENVIFRNCTFSKQVTSLDKLVNIRSIRIFDCRKFDLSFISNLTNLKRILLSNVIISNWNYFKDLKLYSLDISESIVESFEGVELLNISNLIISHKQYIQNREDILKCKFKIMIMAADGYYIEDWIN